MYGDRVVLKECVEWKARRKQLGLKARTVAESKIRAFPTATLQASHNKIKNVSADHASI